MSDFIKQKRLIKEFHHFCITTTYDEYRQFTGSMANAVTKKQLTWSQNSSGKLIQTAGDNFDAKLSTQNGFKQTHSMALFLTQESLSITIADSEVVARLSKKDFQPADFDVITYKGLAKPKMPDMDTCYQVDSMQMLCQKVLRVSRPNDCDLGFLKGILNEESCPEYNGFNTALMRNAGVAKSPPTTVTYIPLVNTNPTDPDTILTSMYKVRQLTEEAGQKYTLFTNDQQLYRIAQQITWWKPEE